MKKFNLIAIALLFVSSVATAQTQTQTKQKFPEKQAAAQAKVDEAQKTLEAAKKATIAAQKTYDAADAKTKPTVQPTLDDAKKAEATAQTAYNAAVAEFEPLKAQPITLLGTWMCNGSSYEIFSRANKKQEEEAAKKKKNEDNIKVTLSKECNDEPTGLPHSVLKSISKDKKFKVTNAGQPTETRSLNLDYFNPDWSCSKPTADVINTFFIRLEQEKNVNVKDCQLTDQIIQEQLWDKNNLLNSTDWTVKVGEKTSSVTPAKMDTIPAGTKLDQVDPDAVWRTCEYSCEFYDWRVLKY